MLNWILSLFFSQTFPFNEIMHFQKFIFMFLQCIDTSLSTFRNPESESSKTTPALYTKNEWPNFKEYMVAIEEEELDENNIRKFTKLIG